MSSVGSLGAIYQLVRDDFEASVARIRKSSPNLKVLRREEYKTASILMYFEGVSHFTTIDELMTLSFGLFEVFLERGEGSELEFLVVSDDTSKLTALARIMERLKGVLGKDKSSSLGSDLGTSSEQDAVVFCMMFYLVIYAKATDAEDINEFECEGWITRTLFGKLAMKNCLDSFRNSSLLGVTITKVFPEYMRVVQKNDKSKRRLAAKLQGRNAIARLSEFSQYLNDPTIRVRQPRWKEWLDMIEVMKCKMNEYPWNVYEAFGESLSSTYSAFPDQRATRALELRQTLGEYPNAAATVSTHIKPKRRAVVKSRDATSVMSEPSAPSVSVSRKSSAATDVSGGYLAASLATGGLILSKSQWAEDSDARHQARLAQSVRNINPLAIRLAEALETWECHRFLEIFHGCLKNDKQEEIFEADGHSMIWELLVYLDSDHRFDDCLAVITACDLLANGDGFFQMGHEKSKSFFIQQMTCARFQSMGISTEFASAYLKFMESLITVKHIDETEDVDYGIAIGCIDTAMSLFLRGAMNNELHKAKDLKERISAPFERQTRMDLMMNHILKFEKKCDCPHDVKTRKGCVATYCKNFYIRGGDSRSKKLRSYFELVRIKFQDLVKEYIEPFHGSAAEMWRGDDLNISQKHCEIIWVTHILTPYTKDSDNVEIITRKGIPELILKVLIHPAYKQHVLVTQHLINMLGELGALGYREGGGLSKMMTHLLAIKVEGVEDKYMGKVLIPHYIYALVTELRNVHAATRNPAEFPFLCNENFLDAGTQHLASNINLLTTTLTQISTAASESQVLTTYCQYIEFHALKIILDIWTQFERAFYIDKLGHQELEFGDPKWMREKILHRCLEEGKKEKDMAQVRRVMTRGWTTVDVKKLEGRNMDSVKAANVFSPLDRRASYKTIAAQTLKLNTEANASTSPASAQALKKRGYARKMTQLVHRTPRLGRTASMASKASKSSLGTPRSLASDVTMTPRRAHNLTGAALRRQATVKSEGAKTFKAIEGDNVKEEADHYYADHFMITLTKSLKAIFMQVRRPDHLCSDETDEDGIPNCKQLRIAGCCGHKLTECRATADLWDCPITKEPVYMAGKCDPNNDGLACEYSQTTAKGQKIYCRLHDNSGAWQNKYHIVQRLIFAMVDFDTPPAALPDILSALSVFLKRGSELNCWTKVRLQLVAKFIIFGGVSEVCRLIARATFHPVRCGFVADVLTNAFYLLSSICTDSVNAATKCRVMDLELMEVLCSNRYAWSSTVRKCYNIVLDKGKIRSDTETLEYPKSIARVVEHDSKDSATEGYLNQIGCNLPATDLVVLNIIERSRIGDFVTVNAASSLATALVYKNYDRKVYFGRIRLPEAIVGALHRFVSQKSHQLVDPQNRMVSNLFRAAGNVALIELNTNKFMRPFGARKDEIKEKKSSKDTDGVGTWECCLERPPTGQDLVITKDYAQFFQMWDYVDDPNNSTAEPIPIRGKPNYEVNIVDVYSTYLVRAEDISDERTMTSAFATFSNLVLDYTNARYFRNMVPIVVSALKRMIHVKPSIYRWLFDCVSNLCKTLHNSVQFGNSCGIEKSVEILPWIMQSKHDNEFTTVLNDLSAWRVNIPTLAVPVTSVIGQQCKNHHNVIRLMEKPNRVFSLLTLMLNLNTENWLEIKAKGAKFCESKQTTPTRVTIPLTIARCATRMLLVASDWGVKVALEEGFLSALLAAWKDVNEDQALLQYEMARCLFAFLHYFHKQLDRSKFEIPEYHHKRLHEEKKDRDKNVKRTAVHDVIYDPRWSELHGSWGQPYHPKLDDDQLALIRENAGPLEYDLSTEIFQYESVDMIPQHGRTGLIAWVYPHNGEDAKDQWGDPIICYTTRQMDTHKVELAECHSFRNVHLADDPESNYTKLNLKDHFDMDGDCLTRPSAWRSLGLRIHDVESIVLNLRRALSHDRAVKNVRFQRVGYALLCYFACEGVGMPFMYVVLERPTDDGNTAPLPTERAWFSAMFRGSRLTAGSRELKGSRQASRQGSRQGSFSIRQSNNSERRLSGRMSGKKGKDMKTKTLRRVSSRVISKSNNSAHKDKAFSPWDLEAMSPQDNRSVVNAVLRAWEQYGHDAFMNRNIMTLISNMMYAGLGNSALLAITSSRALIATYVERVSQVYHSESVSLLGHDPDMTPDRIECLRTTVRKDMAIYKKLLYTGGKWTGNQTVIDFIRLEQACIEKKKDLDVAKVLSLDKKGSQDKKYHIREDALNDLDLRWLRRLATQNYNLAWSCYESDPYPDGVYSMVDHQYRDTVIGHHLMHLAKEHKRRNASKLNPDILSFLRHGIHDIKTQHWCGSKESGRVANMWVSFRASYDLLSIEWKIKPHKADGHPTSGFAIRTPISQVYGIESGLGEKFGSMSSVLLRLLLRGRKQPPNPPGGIWTEEHHYNKHKKKLLRCANKDLVCYISGPKPNDIDASIDGESQVYEDLNMFYIPMLFDSKIDKERILALLITWREACSHSFR